MPALLLCRDGRVIGQLTGVDRSFTAEGVAFELAQARSTYLAMVSPRVSPRVSTRVSIAMSIAT